MIKNKKLIYEIDFEPENFYLVNENGVFGDYESGVWSLNHKIDRSYKGKTPDVGCPIFYLDFEEFNQLFNLKGLEIVWI